MFQHKQLSHTPKTLKAMAYHLTISYQKVDEFHCYDPQLMCKLTEVKNFPKDTLHTHINTHTCAHTRACARAHARTHTHLYE